MNCYECGQKMIIQRDGVSHHVVDGDIDYEADADHVAVEDESDCPECGGTGIGYPVDSRCSRCGGRGYFLAEREEP